MILGCIADDFTGAADLAGILVAEGMATALVTDLAAIESVAADAVVVALKSRSAPATEAVAASLAALAALQAGGARQIFFKYCSTFDSTPEGNIGPVAAALMQALDARGVVVCPAFPANGRTLYQGNLFVGDVPLAESGMRDHPLTPMRDSDIRRWLARQTALPVSHIPHPLVRAGVPSIGAALRDAAGLVVVDAIDDADLRAIGAAVEGAPLVTGGSALAMGLPANFRAQGIEVAAPPRYAPPAGSAVVLAGSCSTMTNRQVARYAEQAPSFAIDVAALLAGEDVGSAAEAFLARHPAEAPLLYSTAPPAASARFVDAAGKNAAAGPIEALLAALARHAAALGATRFVVAGGETSGAVVAALGSGALSVGRSIAPGVPILFDERRALALKSGNFGDEDFLAKAVAELARADA